MHKATGITGDKHKILIISLAPGAVTLEHMIDGLSDPFGELENIKDSLSDPFGELENMKDIDHHPRTWRCNLEQ